MYSDNDLYEDVILVHGFSRQMDSFYNLAEYFASWGLSVITMNLFHSSIFDNDPIQDAEDIIELSNYFSQGEQVVYVGHSSGEMRTIVFASEDTNAIAFLDIDLTDGVYEQTGGEYIGLSYVSSLSIPIWGFFAEPSSCNANGNGLKVYEGTQDDNALLLVESDHCDFEFPTNFVCTLLCENENENFSEEQIKSVILNLSTFYLLFQKGII